jgi:hypothetical protein
LLNLGGCLLFNPDDWYITPKEYEEAKRYGISRQNLDDRIRRCAWGKRKAITTPLQVHKKRSEIMAWDIVGVAKAHGISYQQFRDRLYLGWDEIQAATTPLRDAAKAREIALNASEVWRKYPREFIEMAARNGISYYCFRNRAKNGWDYTRAATILPSPSNAAMRLKELYGEDYFDKLGKRTFAAGRNKKSKEPT